MKFTSRIVVSIIAIGFASAASARDQIRIVGSSTVFPFSTAVAEAFGRTTSFKTPVVESTGSGGGLKLFCKGIGTKHPDIANASRRIKAREIQNCNNAGVKQITEVKIGFDGIVLANSRNASQLKITRKQLYLALAKMVPEHGREGGKLVANPYKRWIQIDRSLPDRKIVVLGPPPTSGTRDAFNELAIEGGCKRFKHMKLLKKKDKKKYKALCRGIREDGIYIEAGENDNLIVQKLEANPDAFGVFGYSFLDQNSDRLQGSVIGGVAPEFEAISLGRYPVSRSLYFYVKTIHVGKVPGIKEFVAEFTSDKAWGPEGYLVDKGLIPLPQKHRADMAASSIAFTNLNMAN